MATGPTPLQTTKQHAINSHGPRTCTSPPYVHLQSTVCATVRPCMTRSGGTRSGVLRMGKPQPPADADRAHRPMFMYFLHADTEARTCDVRLCVLLCLCDVRLCVRLCLCDARLCVRLCLWDVRLCDVYAGCVLAVSVHVPDCRTHLIHCLAL